MELALVAFLLAIGSEIHMCLRKVTNVGEEKSFKAVLRGSPALKSRALELCLIETETSMCIQNRQICSFSFIVTVF